MSYKSHVRRNSVEVSRGEAPPESRGVWGAPGNKEQRVQGVVNTMFSPQGKNGRAGRYKEFFYLTIPGDSTIPEGTNGELFDSRRQFFPPLREG